MNNKLYISLLFIILPVYLWGAVITFFNDNLILQLKAVDILDRATDKVTIYGGDIQTYMYNHHEPRNITFTVRYVFNKARSKYKGTGAGTSEKRRM